MSSRDERAKMLIKHRVIKISVNIQRVIEYLISINVPLLFILNGKSVHMFVWMTKYVGIKKLNLLH